MTVALLKLQETGVLEELKRKWWDYRSQCHDSGKGKALRFTRYSAYFH
jgi:hypothetical protein